MWILALLLVGPAPARAAPREVELQLPARAPLVCEGGAYATANGWRGHCEGHVAVTVKNVTGERVVLETVTMFRVGNMGESQEPHATLAPGDIWKGDLKVDREDRYEVMLVVRYGDRVATGVYPDVVQVANPVRAKATAACRKCHGKWGRQGILGFDGCVCPSPDAGKRCTDGDQCVNGCEFDHFVSVGRSNLKRPVGRCARDDDHFGCRTPIPWGASKQPPQASWSLNTTCTD